MKKINFKKMMMGVALVFGSMFAQNVNAQEHYNGWNYIDDITINQKVNIENAKVYVYGYSTASPKDNKADKKQTAAFESLASTVAEALQKEFTNTHFEVVSDVKDVPADGILVKACLSDIDWGNKALRTWVGCGAGSFKANYNVEVSNANGPMFQFNNRRFHDTTFASAKGSAVIKAYNKAIAKDLAVAFNNIK